MPHQGIPRWVLLFALRMQVLEVLADDSNFRGMAMELSAAPAAAMLALPPEAFESAWCAGDATCSRTTSVTSTQVSSLHALHHQLYTHGAKHCRLVAPQGEGPDVRQTQRLMPEDHGSTHAKHRPTDSRRSRVKTCRVSLRYCWGWHSV